MDKTVFALFVISLFLLVGCTQKLESQQSIQDIVAKTPEPEKQVVKNETKVELPKTNQTQSNQTVNETVSEVEENDVPVEYTKCRYSAIVYGGCQWTDNKQTSFYLRIMSAAHQTIPGGWIYIYGESGGIKKIKRTEDLLKGALRSYTINYQDVAKEIGTVKRIEFLPIEIVNQTEYTCINQKIYAIPSAHCKPSEIPVLNNNNTYN